MERVSRTPGYLTRPLHPMLRPYVGWLLAYDVDLGGPGIHLGLPSTALTLVLPLHEPLDVSWSEPSLSPGQQVSLASGLHTRPAQIRHTGRQTGVQLAISTAGASALLGVPAAALAGELVQLTEFDHSPGLHDLRHLPERLHETPDQHAQLALVERALISALARNGAAGPRAEVGHALASLTRGTAVSAVAEDVGWSRRHLSTQVRAACGLTPKEFQLVARFERSHRMLQHAARTGAVRLADLAADAGYADQAHLTREWVRLAGSTPGRWLQAEFPFLQDRPDEVRQAGRDGATCRPDTETQTALRRPMKEDPDERGTVAHPDLP